MRAVGRACALALCAALTLAACGTSAEEPEGASTPTRTDVPEQLQAVAMERPGAFEPPTASPDILVQSQDPLPDAVVDRAKSLKAVVATEQFSLATFYREEDAVTYAAVNPATFRRFTLGPTATSTEVWDRVADGEMAILPELRERLATADDYVPVGNEDDAEKVHVGAYAPLVDRSKIGAVLNERWADELDMPEGNALLVSTGNAAPAPTLKALRAFVGDRAAVTLLAPDVDPSVAQIAVLTGGSVARAVGSFSYTANRDGTVNPDPRWVAQNIRTEQVPILGTVRCHKVMLIQLRAALTDIVKAGLAKKINPGEYGGCYVPRFIARDPSKGLSFHTFGTALDLNVPGNLRGTVGLMDRTVVKIFEKWGFSWGGYWNYTDPMHFELARLVAVK